MIVLISESLLMRSTATDGRILRDRVLSGFGVRLNARKRTFLVATCHLTPRKRRSSHTPVAVGLSSANCSTKRTVSPASYM